MAGVKGVTAKTDGRGCRYIRDRETIDRAKVFFVYIKTSLKTISLKYIKVFLYVFIYFKVFIKYIILFLNIYIIPYYM